MQQKVEFRCKKAPMVKRKIPREDPIIRSMRVRAWVRAVKLASGLSLAELENTFSQHWMEQISPARSCIWDKYQRGKVVPRIGHKTKQGLSLVERVEEKYPGTAKWLSYPFWRLADKSPMQMTEIREIYEGLPKLLRSIFIAGRYEASEIFWRRPVEDEHVHEILLRLDDNIDALQTALAMVKEAEITQNQDQHFSGINTVKRCLDRLQHDPVLGDGLLVELGKYLERHWKGVVYFAVPKDKYEDDEDSY